MRPQSGVRVEELKRELRQPLQSHLEDWLRQRLRREKLSPEVIDKRVGGLKLSFEPADIVNEVMSFGSPTPVEVAVSGIAFTGPERAKHLDYVERARAVLAEVPSLRDLQYAQPLDYPAVKVQVDRQLVGASGVTTQDVANSVVAATSSSRFVVPNYWCDPATGIGYQVQVEVPTARMNSPREVALVPIKRPKQKGQLFLQDVARIEEGVEPGEYDRYNMRRLVSLTANIEGEDLGRVTSNISEALARAGTTPAGLSVEVRGQVTPMRQMFGGLAGDVRLPAGSPWSNGGDWLRFAQEFFGGLTGGLTLAVVAILLLLTAYFQSLRLALTVVLTAPAVAAGVAALLATGTTLNLQSFMGAIMAVGVAMANAILLVTFAERARRDGAEIMEAAVDGAKHRLRPILMTSCAMVAGMVPMALGLGEGGEQTAPLGRAVIGGLLAATLTTLLVLPALFALIQRGATRLSPSLDPDDQQSQWFDALEDDKVTG